MTQLVTLEEIRVVVCFSYKFWSGDGDLHLLRGTDTALYFNAE